MSIVQPSDFQGKYMLANTTESYIETLIQLAIDDYEPVLLTALLGAELYNGLLEGLIITPPGNDIWVTLKDQLVKSILPFVYWNYQRDNVTSTTGNGEVDNANANSTQNTPRRKMIDRWNEMVINNQTVVKFVQDNTTDYGVYYYIGYPHRLTGFLKSIFCTQNFGI